MNDRINTILRLLSIYVLIFRLVKGLYNMANE